MTDARQQSFGGGIDQSYIHTTETVERPLADRPARDTIDAIAEWLIGPALQVATAAQAVDEFAWRMLAAGFPLARLTVHSGTLHPQFLGTSFIWWRDTGQTVQTFIAHEVADVVPYQHNPVLRVIQGGETLRRRVDEADDKLDLPILRDLKVKGCTDYLALPMAGAHGRRYAITYTTDCVDGFSARQVAELTGISQRMSIACDSFTQRVLMRRLLSIYLGANAGPKVLAGQIRRGTGEELTAVLWSSDLRGFTMRSDRLPGQQMIAILNALFDVQANAIHNHGGEILKFIGDGLLAIFPIDRGARASDAAQNAMAAAMQGLDAVYRLVNDPSMSGEPALQIVVALHAGTVIYGNVVYVTHDQQEAMSLGDQVVVLNKGAIMQVGTPLEVYARPANSFVAEFIGSANLYSGIRHVNADCHTIKVGFGEFALPAALFQQRWRQLPNGPVQLMCRPQDICIAAGSAGHTDVVVDERLFLGDRIRVTGHTSSGERVQFETPYTARIQKGDIVPIEINFENVHLISRHEHATVV